MRRLSIRMRLTVLTMILLSVCCLGLTLVLNLSAGRMADQIEAIPLTNATAYYTENNFIMPGMIITPSTTTTEAKKTFHVESVVTMIGFVTMGGFLTYYVSGKALSPLHELSGQIKNRKVHNLAEEIKLPDCKDEIYEVTENFNTLTYRLEQAFSMQKRFSQSAAHELKTPLTIMKAKLEVFQKKSEHTKGEYENLVSSMLMQINRLSSLVGSLLLLTNLEAVDKTEEVELKELVEEIVTELNPCFVSQQISAVISGEECKVHGNYDLLYRAFYNVIENAIKYSPGNTEIQIEVNKKIKVGEVIIRDQGIGIPKECEDLIFEPFYRIDDSRSRKTGGAGLGLSLVKHIMEEHRGEIEVSKASGGGSEFKIKLPV